jgi:hypothetical protein
LPSDIYFLLNYYYALKFGLKLDNVAPWLIVLASMMLVLPVLASMMLVMSEAGP